MRRTPWVTRRLLRTWSFPGTCTLTGRTVRLRCYVMSLSTQATFPSVRGFVNHMVAVMPMMCVTIGSGWSDFMKASPVSGNKWVRWQQQYVLCMG